jgi:hypothetical protein
MENQKSVADRMRPVLAAMERSIDAARRSRTRQPTPDRPVDRTPAGPTSISPPSPLVGMSRPITSPSAGAKPSNTSAALHNQNFTIGGDPNRDDMRIGSQSAANQPPRLKARAKPLNSSFVA